MPSFEDSVHASEVTTIVIIASACALGDAHLVKLKALLTACLSRPKQESNSLRPCRETAVVAYVQDVHALSSCSYTQLRHKHTNVVVLVKV